MGTISFMPEYHARDCSIDLLYLSTRELDRVLAVWAINAPWVKQIPQATQECNQIRALACLMLSQPVPNDSALTISIGQKPQTASGMAALVSYRSSLFRRPSIIPIGTGVFGNQGNSFMAA